MTKLFLFDIEGTTTDINFVHKVLFPYSEKCMESYVLEHQTHPVVMSATEKLKETVKKEENKDLDITGVVNTLLHWIKTDRKHGALKDIQGLIWGHGYSKNDFRGHVYPDVKPFFERIVESGAKVGIYSSGSVHAQKLIFGYSEAGDLTPMISYYFDTNVGMKRDPNSYMTIAQEVQMEPKEIHFFSDIPEELEAAEKSQFNVTHVLRPGTQASRFASVPNFDKLL